MSTELLARSAAPGHREQGGRAVRHRGPRGRVALVSGVCVRHDAISNAVRSQMDVLRDAGYEVRAFVQATDCLEPPDVAIHASAWSLAGDPFYASADLVVVHYGVRHELFGALVLPHPGRRVVHFHNITPPEVLSGAARALSHDSFELLPAVELADEVWVVSPHNAEVLRSHAAVPPERIRPMELHVPAVDCLAASGAHHVGPRPGDAPEVLTVGRFVPAKGLEDLVDAAARLRHRPVRLTLAGSTRYSDTAHLARLRERIDRLPAGVTGRIAGDVSDPELSRHFDEADVFVSASHHEGFCVPVVEALAHGCRVVVSDAGALPDTVGGCGAVVPVGDAAALADAVDEALDLEWRARHGDGSERAEWEERVGRHLDTFGLAAFRRRLLGAVSELVGRP